MKPARLIDALNRVSRGLSTIIDARMLRDELIDVLELALVTDSPSTPKLRAKLDALRALKL